MHTESSSTVLSAAEELAPREGLQPSPDLPKDTTKTCMLPTIPYLSPHPSFRTCQKLLHCNIVHQIYKCTAVGLSSTASSFTFSLRKKKCKLYTKWAAGFIFSFQVDVIHFTTHLHEVFWRKWEMRISRTQWKFTQTKYSNWEKIILQIKFFTKVSSSYPR